MSGLLVSKRTNFLALFLLFLIGIGIVLGFRFWQVKKVEKTPFLPKKSFFSLQPPSEALTGKLIEVKGEVKKEPRKDEEFQEVEEGKEILDGEKLATRKDSKAVIEFPGFAEVTLDSDSETTFVNLIPSGFLISQSLGSVTYKLWQDNTFLSVRSLYALLTIDSGESEVIVKEEEISIKILSGKAKLALVDLENEIHIWKLEEGQKALIDNAERRVEIK